MSPAEAAVRELADPANLREVAACALCGSPDRRLRFEDPPFSVVECGSCGLVYVTPRLRSDVLPEVYAEDYWRSQSPKDRGYADYRREAPLYLKTFRRRMRLIDRFRPQPGRALDVGCAAGFFLHVLAERGWDVAGVELSPQIAAAAQAELGRERIHVGTLDSAPFPKESFDLVSLWDVVEHVEDPIALLGAARAFLKEDGLLVLETQNVESRFARLLGPRWQHYKHLEHLYHFAPATLDRLLAETGFERVHRTAAFGGKYISVGFLRERVRRIHPLLSALLWPLRPLDRLAFYANPRDELVVVARRID